MAGTSSSGRTADAVPVLDATIDDLDGDAVGALLRRVRERAPRTFERLDDEAVLRRLRVLVAGPRHGTVPTVAGLLALGSRPQHFLPEAGLTLVVYPGISATDRAAGDPTSHSFLGPVPAQAAAAVATAVANLPARSPDEGSDLPAAVLREVVTNALLHRDYTPDITATPQARRVLVAIYARHVTVISPGGLVPPVTAADLADDSARRMPVAARNPVLAKLLAQVEAPDADRPVCVNRGTGIPMVQRELAARDLNRAEFHHHPDWFTVILHRPHRTGRVERRAALEMIRSALASGGTLSRWAIEEATGLNRGTVLNHLNYLIGNDEVESVNNGTSRQRLYRLTGRSRPPR
jgi:ATP-dependent DNA helicase RecG